MPSPRERLLSIETNLSAAEQGDKPHGVQDNLDSYLTTSSLKASVSQSVSALIQNPLLPSNPYSRIIPTLRLAEIRSSLFSTPLLEEAWLSNLEKGTHYGLFNVHSRRTPRKASPVDPQTNIVTLSLSPNHDGSVYGLSHIVNYLDSVGCVSVCKINNQLTETLYPQGITLLSTAEYKESLSTAILPPTTFHGNAFGSGSLDTLVQNVDVTITGPSFEKALSYFSRRIMTEL